MQKVKFLNTNYFPIIRSIINRIKEATETGELISYYEIDPKTNKKVLSIENVDYSQIKPHINKILNSVNRQFNTKIEYYVSSDK